MSNTTVNIKEGRVMRSAVSIIRMCNHQIRDSARTPISYKICFMYSSKEESKDLGIGPQAPTWYSSGPGTGLLRVAALVGVFEL